MATQPTPILVAKSKRDIVLHTHMANRHGLIAGATGTGKTVTLRVLAEQFSHLGVPVFMADVKGDLSGIARRRRRSPEGGGAREGARPRRVSISSLPRRILGCVRQGRPSHPSDRLRDGAAAAQPHPQPERDPERRPDPGLQGGRRQRPAAPGPQGSAGHGPVRGGQRGHLQGAVRECLQGQHRRDATEPSGAPGAGRRVALRRAGPGFRRSDADRCQGAGDDQHPGRRQADAVPHGVRHIPALAAVGAVRATARSGGPAEAEAGVLLRRSAPALRGRAQALGGEDPAGRAPHPVQGGRACIL